jgi:hypothetical protein
MKLEFANEQQRKDFWAGKITLHGEQGSKKLVAKPRGQK